MLWKVLRQHSSEKNELISLGSFLPLSEIFLWHFQTEKTAPTASHGSVLVKPCPAFGIQLSFPCSTLENS